MRVGRHPARPVGTVLAHVGQLPMAFVAALRLPEGILGACHVEDVVDDLKRTPSSARGTEARQSGWSLSAIRRRTHSTDAAISRPVLKLVQAAQADVHVQHQSPRRCTGRRPSR